MSFKRRFMSMLFKLPPATAKKLEYEADLAVPMPDGVTLYADRISPTGGKDLPVIL